MTDAAGWFPRALAISSCRWTYLTGRLPEGGEFRGGKEQSSNRLSLRALGAGMRDRVSFRAVGFLGTPHGQPPIDPSHRLQFPRHISGSLAATIGRAKNTWSLPANGRSAAVRSRTRSPRQ